MCFWLDFLIKVYVQKWENIRFSEDIALYKFEGLLEINYKETEPYGITYKNIWN